MGPTLQLYERAEKQTFNPILIHTNLAHNMLHYLMCVYFAGNTAEWKAATSLFITNAANLMRSIKDVLKSSKSAQTQPNNHLPQEVSNVHTYKLSGHDLAKITGDLKLCAPKWKEIGQGLGFTLDETKYIESRPTLLADAPFSYLSAMLSDWEHWAPGDARGSADYATLDSLRIALDKAGLGRESQGLCL